MNFKLLICSKCKTEFAFDVRDLWKIPVCPRCEGTLIKEKTGEDKSQPVSVKDSV